MIRTPVAADDPAMQRLAAEMFLKAAGPALVKRVAEILRSRQIPIMPLKGVLLQKLVYREQSFRPIVDVDLLVPEAQFTEACGLLRAAGFTDECWESGGWQVTLRDPTGPPLGIDLHRRLSRTSRAWLTSRGMFQRGTPDAQLFGAPVVIPCPEDLLAHLLLHATLHWITLGRLHRTADFEAVASALALDPDRCAKHLAAQGLLTHALVMLPLIGADTRGGFVAALAARLPRRPQTRAAAWLVRAITARYSAGHSTRRLAGLALAPSLSEALITAVRDRFEPGAPRSARPNR
jgi:Uncharacterised nucleotidyltransferase